MKDLTKTGKLVEGSSAILSQEITILLLDNSASMEISMGRTRDWSSQRVTRFSAMKSAALSYIDQRILHNKIGETDRVGVITFDSSARVIADPKYSSAENAKVALESMYPSGCTAMHMAFSLASEMCCTYEDSFIRLVLVSDGEPDKPLDVKDLISFLYNDLGIITDTIAITDSEFNMAANFLRECASLGGGSFTYIKSPDQLKSKFLELESERRNLLGKGILLLGE